LPWASNLSYRKRFTAPTSFDVDSAAVLTQAYAFFGNITTLLYLSIGISIAMMVGRYFKTFFKR
jgi:hypothetical protein